MSLITELQTAIDSLKETATVEATVQTTSQDTVRADLAETIRLAASIVERDTPVIDAHSRMIAELQRPKDDPWFNTVKGRGHTDYDWFEKAIEAFNLHAGSILPKLRSVRGEVEKIAQMEAGYERDNATRNLKATVKNYADGPTAEEKVAAVTSWAGRVAERERKRVAGRSE